MSSPINDVFESLSRMAGCDAVIAAAQAWIEKQNKIIPAPASASAPAEAAAAEKPLKKMSGQELRDIYHSLIGKPVGLGHSRKAPTKAKLITAITELRAGKSSASPVAAGSAAEHVIIEVAPEPAAASAAPAPEPKAKKAKAAKAKSDSEEEKPKRKAAPATMAWNDFVKHCQTKYPERYLDAEGNAVKTPGHRMAVAKAIRAEMPQYYDTFVADFIADYKYTETLAEADAIISTASIASNTSKPKND